MSKTKFMLFGTSQRLKNMAYVQVKVGEENVEKVELFKYLGVFLDPTLNFHEHISHVCNKVGMKLALLGRASKFLQKESLLLLYKSLVLPNIDYCDIIYDSCPQYLKSKLQVLQNKALRIVTKAGRREHIHNLHQACNIMPLEERRQFHLAVFMYKALHSMSPQYIQDKFKYTSSIHSHSTRSVTANHLCIPLVKLNAGKSRISYRGAAKWNCLPVEIANSVSLSHFKRNYIIQNSQ